MNSHKIIGGAALCAAAGLWIGGAFAGAVQTRAASSVPTTIGFDRVTSLERFGMRSEEAFSEKGIRAVREAGFTGVFANGGAGFAADQIPVECLVETRAIPDFMPYSSRRYRTLFRDRLAKLKAAGVKPWICWWGLTGASDCQDGCARTWNARVRAELTAKYRKSPELFGNGGHWRGNRPLCTSHPRVQAFYAELLEGLGREYPEIEGILFFPGDARLENCDDRCRICKATGLDQQERMMRFANAIHAAWARTSPSKRFYYVFWNLGQPAVGKPFDRAQFERVLTGLNPDVGVGMAIADVTERKMGLGTVRLNQPWGTCADIGDQFRLLLDRAAALKRPVMAISEISQSEQFDPVCANMPFAIETLRLLRNVAGEKGIDALCDFWGERPPFLADASHAVQRVFSENPSARDEEILRLAAERHYGAGRAEAGIRAWWAFDRLMREYPLAGWAQRFSFAIGRTGARGPLYGSLTPAGFAECPGWTIKMLLQNGQTRAAFYDAQRAWLPEFEKTAKLFEAVSPDEADRIRLAGRLNVSIGAFVRAEELYREGKSESLRKVIEDEMANREEQLRISARLTPGSGVHPLLVQEDLSAMSLFLSDPDYPNVPADLFTFTPNPIPL